MFESVSSFIICGDTNQGEPFRPSDWAERLCGVMTCFAPNMDARHAHLKYSQYVYPTSYENKKAVFVQAELERIEPMAYRFLVTFAIDNHLRTVLVSSES